MYGNTGSAQYQQRWAADQPGCLIIMVDQSGSMEDGMGAGLIGAGTKKADAAAMVLNKVLNELQKRCIDGQVVRPRVDVAVIGYGPDQTVRSALGGSLANQDIVSIADLAANPLQIKHTMATEFDPETGGLVQIPVDVPIWVEAKHENGTPMCMAFQVAYSIAQNWIMTHPNNFPPVVVNVTDGEATDGDPLPYAQQLAQLATSDGPALVFNCHLSATPGYPILYPTDTSQVPSDKFATQLFHMSSALPDAMMAVGNNQGMALQPGARGFVFGAGVETMSQFITIASLAKVDPSMR
jgi:hypothetical protein